MNTLSLRSIAHNFFHSRHFSTSLSLAVEQLQIQVLDTWTFSLSIFLEGLSVVTDDALRHQSSFCCLNQQLFWGLVRSINFLSSCFLFTQLVQEAHYHLFISSGHLMNVSHSFLAKFWSPPSPFICAIEHDFFKWHPAQLPKENGMFLSCLLHLCLF